MECQRLRTETWAKTANRKCRAAALSGHCWRDLCKAPVNENFQQLKTSPLSYATWRAQAQYSLIKRGGKQRQQASRLMMPCQHSGWFHRVFYFFHTLAPMTRLQAKYNQCHGKPDVITAHSEAGKKKKQSKKKKKNKGPFFKNLSIHSSKAGRGVSSFYAIGKRKWHIQGKQWRQRVKDAGWQLRQLITLEKPERQQRMKVISDSRLGYRLVPMPLVAWGKISKRWLNLDSLSKEQQQLYKSALGEETVVIHIVIASEHNQQMVDSSPACAGHITKRRKLSSEDDID